MNSTWIPFEHSEMSATRAQLHKAVQFPALVARAYLPKVPDDKFAALQWDFESHAFKTQSFGENKEYQVSLHFAEFRLCIENDSGKVTDSIALDGKDLDELLAWLKVEMNKRGLDGSKLTTKIPYELPPFPPACQNKFVAEQAPHRTDIGNYFANAASELGNIEQNYEGTSPVQCWPHHFDIGSLIILEANENPEKIKSIGVGMSPGDDAIDQPYFYVNSWPMPSTENLPELSTGGKWNTEGWVGTTLKAEDLIGKQNQQEMVKKYFASSINHLRSLMKL